MLTSLPTVNLFGLTVQIAGFGKTEAGVSSRMMETVRVKIIPRNECETRVWSVQHQYKINLNHLCGAANPYALMSSVRLI
jgi:hypothetical protein